MALETPGIPLDVDALPETPLHMPKLKLFWTFPPNPLDCSIERGILNSVAANNLFQTAAGKQQTTMQNNSTRLGHRQASILTSVADAPARSILSLEPETDFVHTWHYKAVHRLAKRGLVSLVPAGTGNSIAVHITDAGLAALA